MNGNRVLLDTNAVIAFFDGVPAAEGAIWSFENRSVPVIVVGELRFGALRSHKVTENLSKIDWFVSQCEVLTVQNQTAIEYARIRNDLMRKGRPIPENDIWIAAMAAEYESPLITVDSHFAHVAGIEIIGI
ncbi:MAG: type II toxin-antitoxin system VapC family toxin [Candidatus Omnitrophica bacterium]|nr:type II toxin-antitoxin system VapC family toxin [Candidatus Omnitrophota bacterium]MCA9442474.1 type II toxin-antitoxin system VapC family toxin [Candidatus Omnitrophota bacterium]MCA9446819.1 type II toxin-antitoxin system VapC family toxin [Candidatus Omnitrophota bacterium]MCB9770136.1 type II toxin-antitoxin system VapC family toxin [Candidatus Omnitrophota bacterium]MCB9782982.1 type II toxin-antitoxin system VapC family toxin [Candidatus Omnitrophota bacterium]